jgi:hypothetical protein
MWVISASKGSVMTASMLSTCLMREMVMKEKLTFEHDRIVYKQIARSKVMRLLPLLGSTWLAMMQ